MLKSKPDKRCREKCWDFVDKCGELLIIAANYLKPNIHAGFFDIYYELSAEKRLAQPLKSGRNHQFASRIRRINSASGRFL